MTEIRQPEFRIDLPGTWEGANSDEAETVVYLEQDGGQALFVTMLSMKSSFTIADPQVLLEQYLSHRQQWEKGQIEGLEQTPAGVERDGDVLVGTWSGVEPESGRRVRHKVLLLGRSLGDFAYETFGMTEEEFAEKADAVLASASIAGM